MESKQTEANPGATFNPDYGSWTLNPLKSKGKTLADLQLPLDATPGRKQCLVEPLYTLAPSKHPSEASAGSSKDLFQLFKYLPARVDDVPKVK